jgi:hypothetical protein
MPLLLPWEEPESFDVGLVRPNLILACRRALLPWARPDAADRLEQFLLYPELPSGAFLSESISLGDGRRYVSTHVPLRPDGVALDEAFVERLRAALSAEPEGGDGLAMQVAVLGDPELVARARRTVLTRRADLAVDGWERSSASEVIYRRTDWVLAARETFKKGMATARVPIDPADGPLFTDEWPIADIVNR